MDIQSKIFDPFYTTKSVGMGLSICHNIVVQKHHGRISVLSQPGNTRFMVQLPIKFSESSVIKIDSDLKD